jgi:hypothetical protein
MTVAEARRFVASRGARRSGIAAPLWHIWLPAAPLRQLASSIEYTAVLRQAYLASQTQKCTYGRRGESKFRMNIFEIIWHG